MNALYTVCCFLSARGALHQLEAAHGWGRVEWGLITVLFGSLTVYRLREYLREEKKL